MTIAKGSADLPKKKILPMKVPKLYNYPIYGFLFSVIEEKDMNWVYSNFIQLMYHENWDMPVFEDHLKLFDACPFLKSTVFSYSKGEDEFIGTLKNGIDNENYIHLFLDWVYVNDKYSGPTLPHSTIISGYDDNKQVFIAHDNYGGGRFVSKEISYEDTVKAFFSAVRTGGNDSADSRYLRDIAYEKYDRTVITVIDYKKIFERIGRYLDASPEPVSFYDTKAEYGIDVYERLARKMEKGYSNMTKDLHMLYEHKLLMCKRIEHCFYEKHTDIPEVYEVLEEYEQLCKEHQTLRNSYIKSFFTKEDPSGDDSMFAQKMRTFATRERDTLNKLLTVKDIFVQM